MYYNPLNYITNTLNVFIPFHTFLKGSGQNVGGYNIILATRYTSVVCNTATTTSRLDPSC